MASGDFYVRLADRVTGTDKFSLKIEAARTDEKATPGLTRYYQGRHVAAAQQDCMHSIRLAFRRKLEATGEPHRRVAALFAGIQAQDGAPAQGAVRDLNSAPTIAAARNVEGQLVLFGRPAPAKFDRRHRGDRHTGDTTRRDDSNHGQILDDRTRIRFCAY